MRASSEAHHHDEPLTLRGGYVVDVQVVTRLLDLERRGAHFVLLPAPGRFRVEPPDVLTADDRAFLRAHADEARSVIAYAEREAEA